jgi:hypothetical protein
MNVKLRASAREQFGRFTGGNSFADAFRSAVSYRD